MLRSLTLRDFVLVHQTEVSFVGGFTVLTGETGAGKSILIDALQLALGARADAAVVRPGAQRADVSAEFDAPAANSPLGQWLADAGFDGAGDEATSLLLRRTVDAQGKSRAWVNGSAATATQLRELGEALVDIHGQHAWQSLTRTAGVRTLFDVYAGVQADALRSATQAWRQAQAALADAQARQQTLQTERDRLQWALQEMDRLNPLPGEWAELNAEHSRLANAQALIDAATRSLHLLDDGDESAQRQLARAVAALTDAGRLDAELASLAPMLNDAASQLGDVVHTLNSYLARLEPNPARLGELDARLAEWLGLARRHRRAPDELASLRQQWQAELAGLDAAADLGTLRQAVASAQAAWLAQAQQVSKLRKAAAPKLSKAVTGMMQQLGMGGGRFEVGLTPIAADQGAPVGEGPSPQAQGLEDIEFLVAGHAGAEPRPLGKVASGGELSRIALAVAVVTSRLGNADTLIFDEVDSGVGGAVAEVVGRLLKTLGRDRQVLAVTHLPQVAASADAHFVVTKTAPGSAQGKPASAPLPESRIQPVQGEARVAELARMLGGERLTQTTFAHAQDLLEAADKPAP
jgi:DNA repair protein RecN (Recombination protein N)